MNSPASLDKNIAALLSKGGTLVTANNRLAREVRQQFNIYKARSGRDAWETADILPFNTWIFRLWKDLGEQSEYQRYFDCAVLNSLQSRSVWEQIVSEHIQENEQDSEPLWNVSSTVRAVMDAWRITLEWDISIEDCRKSYLKDHRSFAAWAHSYQTQCRDNCWIDTYQLINEIIHCLNQDFSFNCSPVLWMGFDGFTPQQNRLLTSLQVHKASLSIHNTDSSNNEAHGQFRAYENDYSQWLAAAHWAREMIDQNPDQKIAIVSPSLDKSRNIIDYALKQTLSPHHVIYPQAAPGKPFHISLGQKLTTFAVVDAALILLSLASDQEHEYATISKAILCPYIAGAEAESHPRHNLEYWCRRKLPYRLKLSRFLETLENSNSRPSTPVFLKILQSCRQAAASINGQNSFSRWPELLFAWLDHLGWPGDRVLNSEEFQTVEAFKREVSAIGSLEFVAGPCSLTTVLSILIQRLGEKPFEPESQGVNVEVLGVLETAGLEFDAIWFGGLVEGEWPPALRENAFVPHWLLGGADYFPASPLLNAEHARKQQLRLTSQCREIVFSRHCFDQDVELLPSALFDISPEAHQSGTSLIEYFSSHKPVLELFPETGGQALTDGVSRGGAWAITDQAACPFRAYTRHRLGAQDESPREPGLDARDHGSLVHGIMQGVWTDLQSSTLLHSKPGHELRSIVASNVNKFSGKYFYTSGSSSRFFRIQSDILEQLIIDWLEVEKTREQAFVTVGLEEKRTFTLGKLNLTLKIDRMDKLADNTVALIDYKTGSTGSINEWVGDRPKSPQLPLYALAQENAGTGRPESPLSAVVFAQIRFGQHKYYGICRDQPFQTAKHPTNKVGLLAETGLGEELQDWSVLVEHWREKLTLLADDYCAGKAEVNPLDNKTCEYCDLHGLCRIFEADTSR